MNHLEEETKEEEKEEWEDLGKNDQPQDEMSARQRRIKQEEQDFADEFEIDFTGKNSKY